MKEFFRKSSKRKLKKNHSEKKNESDINAARKSLKIHTVLREGG